MRKNEMRNLIMVHGAPMLWNYHFAFFYFKGWARAPSFPFRDLMSVLYFQLFLSRHFKFSLSYPLFNFPSLAPHPHVHCFVVYIPFSLHLVVLIQLLFSRTNSKSISPTVNNSTALNVLGSIQPNSLYSTYFTLLGFGRFPPTRNPCLKIMHQCAPSRPKIESRF